MMCARVEPPIASVQGSSDPGLFARRLLVALSLSLFLSFSFSLFCLLAAAVVVVVLGGCGGGGEREGDVEVINAMARVGIHGSEYFSVAHDPRLVRGRDEDVK